ncbi:MAG: Crp/Fnr family transcriptional regulator [Saprospiraceae bacterium]|nr:Crp/Fnr family transcriptional regulator [Saprospiraceae bacterium]
MSSIRRHIDPTADEESYFLSLLQTMEVKKRRFLLQEGDVCRHSAFVVNGCMRSYTVDDNGFEHILQFAPEGWWIADMYSFISGRPGQLYIDALEHSELLLLSKSNQEKLYHDVPKFERFFRIIVENSLVAGRQRILDNMSLSATQRYDQFCQQYPTLIHRLPQKQIAAYIGVTPEFLSKLRGEKARRK